MKVTFIIVALALAAFLLARHLLAPQPPLRGLARVPAASQPSLASRARPPVWFVPAAGMELRAAGWRDISPETRVSLQGEARAWFATYRDGQGLLVTALLETRDPWTWEPAHHEPFPTARQQHYDQDGRTLYESLYVLPAEKNPFPPEDGAAASLVYRAKFLRQHDAVQVLVEYRESVRSGLPGDASFDSAALDRIQQRGRAACRVVFPDRDALEGLRQGITALGPAPDAFSRRRLSRWAGELRRPRDI